MILPGYTEAHRTSCAPYLEEGIPGPDYWDVQLEPQDPAVIRDNILKFLGFHGPAGVV